MTSKAFMNLVKARRSYYNISAKSLVDRSAIKEIVDQAVLHTPTSYNVQGGRVVLFYDEAHSQLWDVVREHTLAWLPKDNEEMIKMQSGKLDGYSAGYGTVVFLEDEDTIAASRKRAPQFGDLFETWTEASSAMLQYVVWTALEAEGFGASLQHHTAMMKELSPALHKAFDIPTQWKVSI
jgi:predicted oxidoreductase (fatty acid repression mutant protein)